MLFYTVYFLNNVFYLLLFVFYIDFFLTYSNDSEIEKKNLPLRFHQKYVHYITYESFKHSSFYIPPIGTSPGIQNPAPTHTPTRDCLKKISLRPRIAHPR